MDYKEKYEMALEGIQEILGSGEDSIKMSRLQLRLQGIFPELKESEDERIRKAIHIYLDWLDGRNKDYHPKGVYTIKDMIAWLDKQGKHQKFRDSIQVGDKVTRNEDGVLVNLSQLNRVAKKQGKQETLCDKCRKEQPSHSCQDITELGRCALEKQGEQKPVWSEEDELIVAKILCICNDFERSFECSPSSTKVIKEDVDKIDTWLKSIKDKYTWKPSEEQMNALNYVVNLMASSERPTENDLYYNILKSLRQQLKKLREE